MSRNLYAGTSSGTVPGATHVATIEPNTSSHAPSCDLERAAPTTFSIAARTTSGASRCTKCPESVATTWIAFEERPARRA